MQNRGRRCGFTLIELLVVVAIIAILAAILLPVFAASKERGRQMTCLGNLKTLWNSWRMYADDFDGRFPTVRAFNTDSDPANNKNGGTSTLPQLNWCGANGVGRDIQLEKGQIWKYARARKVFVCPSDQRLPALAAGGVRDYPLSYSANWTLSWKRSDAIPSDQYRGPRTILMLIHEDRTSINDGDFMWYRGDAPDRVHFDGTNLVYVDGHAGRLATKQIQAQIDLSSQMADSNKAGPYDARRQPPYYP